MLVTSGDMSRIPPQSWLWVKRNQIFILLYGRRGPWCEVPKITPSFALENRLRGWRLYLDFLYAHIYRPCLYPIRSFYSFPCSWILVCVCISYGSACVTLECYERMRAYGCLVILIQRAAQSIKVNWEKDFPCNERIQLINRINKQTKKRPKLFSPRGILNWRTRSIYWLPWFLLISNNLYIPPPRPMADITHMPCVSLFGAALLVTHHLFVHGLKAMSIIALEEI